MKVAFISLGCAKNLVNAEQMMFLTRQAGHEVLAEPRNADICVLNTCGFIETAQSEAIEHVLALAELKAEGALGKILVTGCLTQRYGEEVMEQLPEIDGILGTGSYHQIVEALTMLAQGQTPRLFGDISHTEEEIGRIRATPHYSAYLKIAEGCDNRCAYCVIPSLRGSYRSRPMENLIEEAKQLAADGVRELIVVAQDITRYGTDLYGKRRLYELLQALCQIEDLHWVRLHYLYPDEIDEALVETIAREPKILKYIDLPIQHINDRILKSMNRRSTGTEIRKLLVYLREKIPGVVLRTSIITGLPGEDEAAFEELVSFLREARIERAGVFPFSPQEGTEAVSLPNQVDAEVAQARAERLRALQMEIMEQHCEQMLGRALEVLCEGFDPQEGCYTGRSFADSPDIDGCVLFTAAGKPQPGSFLTVHITSTQDGDLFGEAE